MKLISVQGHFGSLNGVKIEFPDGFSRLVLPNGWGKTTLCALIRVMFYGLNTSKRDTARALSDKTKYVPQDGKPMSGRMEIEWNGRRVTIIRDTGKGGPMQDFQAFFTDSGEKCRLLTAKNCGQVILGMGEDAFLSTMMVDGEDVTRPSEELQELLSGMAQTGDTRGQQLAARKRLERWRLDIDSGNGRGELHQIRMRIGGVEQSMARMEELEHRLAEARADVEVKKKRAEQAEADYESGYREFAEHLAGQENRLTILKEEQEKKINALARSLPDEYKIRMASEALLGYEGAVRLEQEKRGEVPLAETQREQELREIAENEHLEEIERNRKSRPRLHWIALCFALVFAVSAAVTGVFEISFIEFAYLPYVLSGLALLSLFLAFLGSVPKPEAPTNFERERQQLDLEYQRKWHDQQMANSVLDEERARVIELARESGCDVTTIEEASAWIRKQESDLQLLRAAQSELGDILIEMRRRETDPEYKIQADRVEAQKAAVREEQEKMRAAQDFAARLRGQMEEIGTREQLEAEHARLKAQMDQMLKRYRAIELAEEVLAEESEKLRAKISPEITSRAAEYMAFLTDDRYQEIRVDERLRASTGMGDGRMLDEQRLSSGTRDQLYLALRLAVCDTLEQTKSVPLILDDPFITSDDARTARGIELLRRLGRQRQIILLSCRKS